MLWGWVDRREKEGSDKTEDRAGPAHRPAPLWVRWRQDGTISSLVHVRVMEGIALDKATA